MIIQNILFPSKDFNPVLAAFARIKGTTNFAANIKELIMQKGARAEFNTYFNGMSIEKWRKYTMLGNIVLHLELEGKFTVIVYNEYRADNKNVRKEICRYPFVSVVMEERPSGGSEVSAEVVDNNSASDETPALYEKHITELEIPIPEQDYRGMISFALVSEAANSAFKGGYYYTDQEDCFPDPHFAVDICTFKREKFVKRNMDLLRTQVFAEGSVLKNAFEVFISDNGQSLILDGDYDGKVHVFPNKNAGGAGGFGRAMVEILRSPNYEKFSHIIMMDDDIVFSYETLYRTFMMAKLLKDEYKNAFIGGAMLRLNDPKTQSEALDMWEVTKHRPVKYQYDITDLGFVMKNEIEDKGNYFGWWYCVMPIGVVKANNLPLPIFIKRDDIEYGIRNGRTFINLNGICVLHEAFGNKRQGYLEYYYWRNVCILNAIHFNYDKETLKDQLKTLMKDSLIRYRYDDANLAFTGVEDFLRGVDWLKTTDVEALNTYVMNYTYKADTTDKISPAFAHGAYEKSLAAEAGLKKKVMSKKGKTLYRKVLLGWLRKPAGVRYVRMNNPAIYNFYAVKRVINYDEESDKAFVTYKSWRELINLLKNYKKLCKLIDEKYDAVRQEYKLRANELTNLSFWDAYLGLDGTMAQSRNFAEESIILNSAALREKNHKKQVRKKDAKHLRHIRISRFFQRLLALVLPIKRNRVCFYLHERKGYTCNLKYISDELLKRYPDKTEIIWVTRFPETCEQLSGKGIKVVKLWSFKHWYYQFTSKVVIVNDAFPESVVIRPRQFTVNTWHASMNYKKIGPKNVKFRNDIAEKIFYIRNKQPKMYVSGSKYFTEDTSASFGFKQKVFVPFGMPRNDIFFRNNDELVVKIKEQYALPAKCKLVLYAPTFRDGFKEDVYGIDFERLVSALHEKFGGEWKVLYRKHYFVNSKDVILDKNTIDVSAYEDMNELLAVADVLISDYSSCLWDFSITERPSFVYAPDIDSYHSNDRDFSYPLEKWPYSISKDNDELEKNILSFDKKEYVKKIKQHHKDGGLYDDGHASERVVNVLAKVMKLKKY